LPGLRRALKGNNDGKSQSGRAPGAGFWKAGRSIASLAETSQLVMSSVPEISSALKERSQASNDIARHVESIA